MLGERFCREAGAILLDDPAITDPARRAARPQPRRRPMHRRSAPTSACARSCAMTPCARVSPDCRSRRAGASPAKRAPAAASTWRMPRATSRDVNPAAVEALFRDTDAALMIHGHTHRPAVHRPGSGQRGSHAYRAGRLARRCKCRPLGHRRLAAHALPGVVQTWRGPAGRVSSRDSAPRSDVRSLGTPPRPSMRAAADAVSARSRRARVRALHPAGCRHWRSGASGSLAMQL